jgi:hypothetical protein
MQKLLAAGVVVAVAAGGILVATGVFRPAPTKAKT